MALNEENGTGNIPAFAPARRAQAPAEGGEKALLSFLEEVQTFSRCDELGEAVSRLIRRLVHSEGAGLMMLDRSKQEFFFPAASVADEDLESTLRTLHVPAGPHPFKLLFPSGAASLIQDARQVGQVRPHLSRSMDEFTRNRLDVPLCAGGAAIVGSLWAVNRRTGPFDEHSITVMRALAGVTGMALERIDAAFRPVWPDGHAKHQIVHQLSHAIKTPLAVSIACLKLLEKHLRHLPNVGWQRIYRRAERNLERLLTIEYEMEDILRPHASQGPFFFSGSKQPQAGRPETQGQTTAVPKRLDAE